jgi:flagellin
MGLRISTNIAAMSGQRALWHTSEDQKKSYQRLSSGQRITSAGDDAAGLAISENLRAQVRSLSQAERNANDGISFVQVAEGGLNEVGNILIRLRELAIQAASDTIGDKERGFIDKEVQSMISEVDRIASVTQFNGTPLLNGESEKDELSFQVGITKADDDSDRIIFKPNDYNVKSGELEIEGLSYESIDDAREALEKVDLAMGKVFEARAGLGATQNKLHATVNNIQIAKENLAAARSRIADTDIATETTEMVQRNILQSAGVSVLAQANMAPQQALKLL